MGSLYFNGSVEGNAQASTRHAGKKDSLELYGETDYGEGIAIKAYLSFNLETRKDEITVFLVEPSKEENDYTPREIRIGIFTKDDLDKNFEVVRS